MIIIRFRGAPGSHSLFILSKLFIGVACLVLMTRKDTLLVVAKN